jgi:hypothetical protein
MQIPHFKRCYPTVDKFRDIIKVKSLEDWDVQYVNGYWIAESPFYDDGFEIYRDLVSTFPIVKDTNLDGNTEANPFATIHLPEWCCLDLFLLLKSYFESSFPYYTSMNFSEWGNLYFKKESRPWDYFRLPHCDGPYGIVSNFWFTDHPIEESGTRIYKYHGKTIKGPDNKLYFDYQCDSKHPLFEECKHLSINKTRLDEWKPLTEEEEKHWGFERLAVAPSYKNTMTIYNTETPHCPFVGDTCEFRWSHAYSINYTPLL